MGMSFQSKDGKGGKKEVHVYVGPDIEDGQEKFKGDKMRKPDGTKNYTHIKDGKVVRAPGVPGDRSKKW